eukprot:Skav225030  [mRNA]  locus=scaffold2061:101525:104040:+ [translate_table: standard]
MEERARVPLFMTYRAVGSSTGQKEFVGNSASQFMSLNHFGAGDIPMTQDRFNTMAGQSPPQDMVHIPLALGALAVFHSVPADDIGGSLKLDACLLAKIFSGVVDTWDHADIKAQNPNINVPAGQPIHVFHRTLGSSSTGGAFISMVVNDPDSLAMEFGFTPPSSTLKDLSLGAAGQIVYPSAMQAFEFESSTNAYGGMATNVHLGNGVKKPVSLCQTYGEAWRTMENHCSLNPCKPILHFQTAHQIVPSETLKAVQDQCEASLLRYLRQQRHAGSC